MRYSSYVRLALAGLLFCNFTVAQPYTNIDVYTDAWPPYVHAEGQESGAATRIVKLALRKMRLDPHWRHADFGLVYEMVNNNEVRLAYPYFKTVARKRDYPNVHFSAPLMTVENVLYYNRDAHDFATPPTSLGNLRMGRVAGYAYGEKFDNWLEDAKVYQSEVLALRALFDNEIDLLPMALRVGQALTLEHFPWQYHALKHLPGEAYSSQGSVHLVTHDDPAGRAFIEQFDEALRSLAGDDKQVEVMETALQPGTSTGYVRLVVGEGHPVVIGQTHKQPDHPDNRYIMIPPGSRALVLEWSSEVFEEFSSPKIYPAMVAVSQVRIVDGPHVGREFYVKNLHIEIE